MSAKTLFLVYRRDRDTGNQEIRASLRAEHLAYLEELGQRIRVGGPMFDRDGKTPVGSMLVLSADSLEEAVAIAQRDPYFEAQLFRCQEVTVWRWLSNPPPSQA